MLQFLRKAALLTAACLVFAGLSFAQMGTFIGEVKGPDGKGLKDAVIKIERKDIKGNWQTKSNKKGSWIYSGMPVPGQFRVTCEVDGKVVDVLDGVRSQMGDPVEINFDLQKLAAKNQAMQKAAETGQLTQEMAKEMSPEARAQMEKQMKERSAAMAKNKALNDAFNGGMTALNAKDYPTAIDSFNKAAEIDPKQYAVWANLATCHEGVANAKAGPERDAALTKATEAYQKALEIKPDDAGVHNNYALALVKLKKIDEAKVELEKAATLDPPNGGRYFFNLGAVMVNTGQNDAALGAFEKCIQVAPTYAECYYYKGNVLSGKLTMDGDKPVAPAGMKEALEKYLELAPTGPNAEAAKGLLTAISTTIQTNYVNPDAKKAPAKKKK